MAFSTLATQSEDKFVRQAYQRRKDGIIFFNMRMQQAEKDRRRMVEYKRRVDESERHKKCLHSYQSLHSTSILPIPFTHPICFTLKGIPQSTDKSIISVLFITINPHPRTERRGIVIKSQWRMYERHAEILQILISCKHETMYNLAHRFNVSRRTIWNDIAQLTASYPIETVRGKYGGVKLSNDYGKYQNKLGQEEQDVLFKIASDPLYERERPTILKILQRLGSKSNKDRINNLR